MSKKNEALKLALEALEQIAAYRPLTFAECSDAEAVMRIAENAIPYLQEALAEQPAQDEDQAHYKQVVDGVREVFNAKRKQQPAQQTIHCKHRRENNGVCPHHNLHCGWPKCNEPEQPAQQEPVAWKDKIYGNLHHQDFGNSIPLYTSPPASKPLTLGQKQRLWSSLGNKPTLKDRVNAFGLAIEAAHGIKGDA